MFIFCSFYWPVTECFNIGTEGENRACLLNDSVSFCCSDGVISLSSGLFESDLFVLGSPSYQVSLQKMNVHDRSILDQNQSSNIWAMTSYIIYGNPVHAHHNCSVNFLSNHWYKWFDNCLCLLYPTLLMLTMAFSFTALNEYDNDIKSDGLGPSLGFNFFPVFQ